MPSVTNIGPVNIDTISGAVNENFGVATGNSATSDLPQYPSPLSAELTSANTTVVQVAKKKQDEKAPAQAKSTNPTIASQPRGTPVVQTITYADPNAATAIIKQAAQRMLMLSMMGNMTSPNGMRNIMAGSLGRMFQNLINAYGIGPIVGMLNNVLPGIGSALGNTLNYALETAMHRALSGQNAGVYTTTSVQAATQTAASIAAINAAQQATNTLTAQAASLGGNALGLDTATLAATIASVAAGTNIKQTVTVGKSVIDLNVYVANNEIQLSLPQIPQLTGNEHINLADVTAASLTDAIIREIKLAGNPSNLTQQQFVNVVTSNYNTAQNSALKMILGYGLNQLITNGLNMLFPGSQPLYRQPTDFYYRSLINPSSISQSRTKAIRNIALSRMAFQTANMFMNSPYMTGEQLAYGLVKQAAAIAIGSSLQVQYRGLVYTALRRL
jgi:hypothetical protein